MTSPALDRDEWRSAAWAEDRYGPHEHPTDCRCRPCLADEAKGERDV